MTGPWELGIYNPQLEALPNDLIHHWKQGWAEVQTEIGAHEVGTDLAELFKQSQVLCLRNEGQIAASVCHRIVNLSDRTLYDDGYFKKAWTSTDIDFLLRRGGQAVLGSQILVEKEFRRKEGSPRARELITYLSFGLLDRMNVDFVVGTMRVNRGMSELFVKSGAILLNRDLPYEQVRVDLVYFELQRRKFRIASEYLDLVNSLLIQNDLRKQTALVQQKRRVA